MAQGWANTCSHCGNEIGAWDDGNPYHLDMDRLLVRGLPRYRSKVYVYHPHEPDIPIEGNDVPHLCMACNHVFNVDSQKPRTTCTKCRSTDIADCCTLQGRTCPKCKNGTFEVGGFRIS